MKTQINIATLSLIIFILGTFLNAQAINPSGNVPATNIIDMQLLCSKSEVMTVISPTNETFEYTFLKSDVLDELTLLLLDDDIIMN